MPFTIQKWLIMYFFIYLIKYKICKCFRKKWSMFFCLYLLLNASWKLSLRLVNYMSLTKMWPLWPLFSSYDRLVLCFSGLIVCWVICLLFIDQTVTTLTVFFFIWPVVSLMFQWSHCLLGDFLFIFLPKCDYFDRFFIHMTGKSYFRG